MWALKAFEQTLRDSQPEVQETYLRAAADAEEDVAVHDCYIQQVEEDPLPPLQGAMGETIIEDHLIT